jgi:hypothetical protein
MKTRLVFLVLLIACFSCGTNNKPVSDAQKEKIKGEIKEVVNTIFKGAEEANFEMATEPWLDSPDFVLINNGMTLSYKEVVDAFKPLFGTLLNQKITIVDEEYAVLDKSTVLYTTNCNSLMNFKAGHSTLADPEAMQFMFKKINNRWKVIYAVDSYVEKTVKYKEPSKELNQVELLKQFLGSWKCDIAKDTTAFWDTKTFGTGLEVNYRSVTKGRIVMEGKGLYGYDKSLDKCIDAGLVKGKDIGMYTFWFKSNSKYELIPYNDLSNPEKASFKVEGELKSPDIIIETTIVNNKPVKTDTWTRVK